MENRDIELLASIVDQVDTYKVGDLEASHYALRNVLAVIHQWLEGDLNSNGALEDVYDAIAASILPSRDWEE